MFIPRGLEGSSPSLFIPFKETSTPPPPPAPAPVPTQVRPHWDSCDSLNNLDPSEKGEW